MFSGGGPLGALQVGALRALLEDAIVPDLAVGTSVGALNATFVAFDPSAGGIARLEGIWRSMDDNDLFPGGRFRASWARMLVRGNRVFENSGLKGVITKRLGNPRFEEAQIPLGIVATELDTGAEKVFGSGEVLLPMLASAAMPGVYPPVEIDGTLYIDGGVANNVPIAPAVSMGGTTLYVMNSTSHSHQRRPLNRPIDYLLHAFTLARAQRLDLELAIYHERVRIIMLPTAPLNFFVPFASMEHTARLIEMGYEHTRKFLDGKLEVTSQKVGEATVEAIAPAK